MSLFQIKEYSSEYQLEIIDIILTIQKDEYNIPITVEEQPDLLNIKKFYQTGNGNFWIAIFENRVIGTISLLDIGNQQVALRKLFVNREYRGKEYNIAKILLEKAIDWAREHSVSVLFLGTTSQFLAAHRFYKKNNFEEINRKNLPSNFPILSVDTKFYKYIL